MKTAEEYAKLAEYYLANIVVPDPKHEGWTITHYPNAVQLASAHIYATLSQAAAVQETLAWCRRFENRE